MAACNFDGLVQSMELGLHVPDVNVNRKSSLLASWNRGHWTPQAADDTGFFTVSGRRNMAMATREGRNSCGMTAGCAAMVGNWRSVGCRHVREIDIVHGLGHA